MRCRGPQADGVVFEAGSLHDRNTDRDRQGQRHTRYGRYKDLMMTENAVIYTSSSPFALLPPASSIICLAPSPRATRASVEDSGWERCVLLRI